MGKSVLPVSTLIGLETERKMLMACLKARRPALLIGETGTGKTTLAYEVGAKVCPAGVRRINLNGGTTPDELEGRYQLKGQETYFQYGVLVEAMQKGELLLLDELNAALPDTLFVLHAILEEHPRLYIPETGQEIVPHPDFRVVATMNPTQDYAGTRPLNLALYSRFGAVIRFEPLIGAGLLRALLAHCPQLDLETASKIVNVVDSLTTLRQAQKLLTPIGIREAVSAAVFASDGLTLTESITAAISAKLEPQERDTVKANKVSLRTIRKATATTLQELIVLAESAQDAIKESGRLAAKLEKYAGLITALKAVGVDTAEDVAELAAKTGGEQQP